MDNFESIKHYLDIFTSSELNRRALSNYFGLVKSSSIDLSHGCYVSYKRTISSFRILAVF